ncbi:MAG TPA: hypothetical protein VF344_07085 [Candidatus Limnocylindrales bacterium]
MEAAGDLKVRLAAFEWLQEQVELGSSETPEPLRAIPAGFVIPAGDPACPA